MMPYPPRIAAALRCAAIAVLPVLMVGCVSKPATVIAPRGESEAMMAAENALREGDCRKASESILAAALASRDASVAARASQLAVGCEQLGPARQAARRWLELEPYSGDAALTSALVALKRYDLVESRKALTTWRDSGSAGNQDPLRFADLLAQETDPAATYRVFREVLVGDDPTADVLLAQARLALAAQNMRAAREAAAQALKLDADLIEARVIELRAQSVQGEHEAAIAGARALDGKLADDDVFLLADFLSAADRDADARRELTSLAAAAPTRLGAERRLIALDLQEGNFEAAEQRLAPLLRERGAAAMALLISAQIAERRGDEARAVQNYRLLADSSLALAARSAAARILLKRGDSKTALALLDDYAEQNPEARVDVGNTKSQLLAQAGKLDEALKVLDDLDSRYPDHPAIQYQRATALETGGRTRDALAQFERALKSRPDDPQLTNALGFTLADHGQKLDRAEALVRHAIEISPDSPAIQDSLGWVLFRRGKIKEALPVLQRAWRNSGDAEIAAHYGEALWKSGDEGQARYVWQQALNVSPNHENLKATQARLTGEGAGKR